MQKLQVDPRPRLIHEEIFSGDDDDDVRVLDTDEDLLREMDKLLNNLML